MDNIASMHLKIGRNIKKFRKQAGMTQEKLADTVGISLRYVQSIEDSSRIPTIMMLAKIATALHKNIKKLF
jgi:transcriptional regulator with XRE-family HTH domain